MEPSPPEERGGFQGFEEAVGTMEGQGVAASAASEAGRHGEPGAGAVVAADKGYDAVSARVSAITGAIPNIPNRSNRRPGSAGRTRCQQS